MKRSNFKNRIKIQSIIHRLIECPAFWICALAFVLLFTLISKNEFWSGYDTYFHMNGIYEDAMQIKTGHYSYFISLFGFERSGRIVNSLYGPIFNYLCGALLLLCGSWIRFEFILFFITLAISGLGIYACAKELNVTRYLATLMAMFYMISRPVLMIWIGNFEFTGLGAAVLLPFVLLIGIKIVEQRRIKVIPLAVMMTICLQIHLMTSLIAALALVPFFICGIWLSKHRVKMITNAVWSVILAGCLSGNIFGAIYDVYSTNHLIPTFPNFHLQTRLGNKTLFFQNHVIQGMGLLYTGLVVVVIIGMLLELKSTDVFDWCLLFEDLAFMWLSSVYFPWDLMLKICPELASIVQFPVRFMAISFILTLLLFARIVSRIPLKPQVVIDLVMIIAFGFTFQSAFQTVRNSSQVWQSNRVIQYWVKPSPRGGYSRDFNNGPKLRAALRSPNLGAGLNVVHKVTTDYMPTPHQISLQTYYHNPFNPDYIRIFKNQRQYHKVAGHHMMTMTWQSRYPQLMQVPLVKYGRTWVMMNHHLIHPQRTLIGTMMVKARGGMNHIQIQYQPSKVFKLLSFITIISWLGIIIYPIYRRKEL